MKNKKIVINSLALALGIGALSPAASSIVAEGSDLSPLISQAYAAEENVDDKIDNDNSTSENIIKDDDELGDLEGLEVAPDTEKQAVGAEESKSITYKNYETEIKYSDQLAYGDYKVDQEGTLGQYEGDKEIVAPVNKIITVGTNKDLVDKIKYNEKYSIEDPGTFDYIEHALRNINPSNKGLKRDLYTINESLNGLDKDGNEIYLNTNICVSDGRDLSKEIDEQIKLGTKTLNENLFLYPINPKEKNEYIDIYKDFSNYIDNLRKLDEGIDRVRSFSTASDIIQYLTEQGYNENSFHVDNSYKTPIIIDNNKESKVFLNKEIFDQVYKNMHKSFYKKIKSINQNLSNIIINEEFSEIPKSFQSKSYEDHKGEQIHAHIWIQNTLMNPTEINNNKDVNNSNLELLNPEKTYKIEVILNNYTAEYLNSVDHETAQKAVNFTLIENGSNLGNLYYYNIRNIPYLSDPNLKFKEVVEENVANKNVILPTYNRFQDEYEDLLYEFSANKNNLQKEEIELIEQFLKSGRVNYNKILNSEKLTENRHEFLHKNIADLIEKNVDNYQLGRINKIMPDDLMMEASSREALKFLNNDTWSNRTPYKRIGNIDTKVEERDFQVIKKEDPTLEEGKTKVETKGVKGKKVTKITYKVNRVNGELTDPIEEVVEDVKPVNEVVLVGTKKVTPAKPIEDIAKTTKKSKEVIKAKVVYESDDSLKFEEQVVDKAPVDGEKEITTISQKGKDDVVTEDIIKESEDGKTRVGNKKVEVKNNDDGSVTTTTTIYDVDPNTGELVNPRSTSKTTMDAKPIEDNAKTTKKAKEVIKAKVQYEADDSLKFEEQVVDKAPVDGEKEITTISQKGKDDVVTEDIIKESEDGKTRVGNKKVEVKNNDDGSVTTTTTIYDVDPNTGELVNPRSTSKTTMPAKTIENIAKPIENAKPKVSAPAQTAPARTNVKAQTGGGVGAIGGLIVGLTAAASSIFKRRKK